MPYLLVEDFKFGMDRRRNRVSGILGTLWDAKNVTITRGGDVRRAKSFVQQYTLPAGTVGLAHAGRQLYVFGGGAAPAGIPPQVRYLRLQPPSGQTLVRILDWAQFDAKLYVIAEYDDGNIYHFQNTTRITEWETVADGVSSTYDDFALHMAKKISEEDGVTAVRVGTSVIITADVPGTPFTISQSTTDNGGTNDQTITLTTNQANVAAVAEVRATGTLTVASGYENPSNVVTGVYANGVNLISSEVAWTGSNANTAALISAAINANTGTHGYTALAASTVVTITAPMGLGATANAYALSITTEVGSAMSIGISSFAGGVTAVAAVAQVVTAAFGGTFEPTDSFTITVNGTAYTSTPRAANMGTSVFVTKSRVYCTANSLIRYCALNDPTTWVIPGSPTTASAGFISVATATNSSAELAALADFDGNVAAFGEDNIAIYSLNANTDNDVLIRVMPNIGTRSPNSVVSYSANDVFFLDASGVRSIRTRAIDGTTRTDDIGTVVDSAIQDFSRLTGEPNTIRAKGVIEPDDNLFMLAMGDRIWVFGQFPSVNIAAWSYIEVPFTLTDITRTPRKLYARDATRIYLYGGATGEEFDLADTAAPVVTTPFFAAQDEASIKTITGFDIACTGTWQVNLLLDPNDETRKLDIGRYSGVTYPQPHIDLAGSTSHFAFEFTCVSDYEATISSFALHYMVEEKR